MALRLVYTTIKGEFRDSVVKMHEPIAVAASAAISEAGREIKAKGRADIAAAGFSARWQNAFRVDVFPRGNKVSVNAAAWVYHKIGYADVFESGATIRGKPLMWLALPGTPRKIASQKATPKLYREHVGPLRFVKRPGKNPLLFAEQATSRSRRRQGRFSLSSLRRGASGHGATTSVPLFVGIDKVTIQKRFNIGQLIADTASRLEALYFKHLDTED